MAGTENEETLQREVDELKRQVRQRDEFLSVVGHELRNPVSPLYMQIAVISERAKAATGEIEKAWLLTELERLTRRFDYFIGCLNRLLDVTKISEQQFDLRPEDCDLVEIVRTGIKAFPEIARLGITITLDGVSTLRGYWDRLRLEQIVANLVSNAIRYGLGRPIQVTVDTDEQERARLIVRDQGVGIAADDLPMIFDRFRQGGKERRKAGFGVGLWVVCELCRAMHGEVTVTSELGRGSTFTVVLPRRTSAA